MQFENVNAKDTHIENILNATYPSIEHHTMMWSGSKPFKKIKKHELTLSSMKRLSHWEAMKQTLLSPQIRSLINATRNRENKHVSTSKIKAFNKSTHDTRAF